MAKTIIKNILTFLILLVMFITCIGAISTQDVLFIITGCLSIPAVIIKSWQYIKNINND